MDDVVPIGKRHLIAVKCAMHYKPAKSGDSLPWHLHSKSSMGFVLRSQKSKKLRCDYQQTIKCAKRESIMASTLVPGTIYILFYDPNFSYNIAINSIHGAALVCMTYFDNAATTFPKPEAVYQACDQFLRRAANPGRGGHRRSLDSTRLIFEARQSIAAFFGIKQVQRLVFTPGCTYSLNAALKGFGLKAGDLVVTTSAEHNSVMRPLAQLKRDVGIKVEQLPYCPEHLFNVDDLKNVLSENKIRLCVINHVSNVTGAIGDIYSAAELCYRYNVPLVIDAAQSAGYLDIDASTKGISMWCAPGHKGLMGPAGVGLLYVQEDIEIEPLVSGGTGSFSEQFAAPVAFPDRLEAGTLPAPAIVGLSAGVEWLKQTGIANVAEKKQELTSRFLQWAREQDFLEIFGPSEKTPRAGLVSFRIRGLNSSSVSDLLDREYGIAVRSGLHCSASVHTALGTLQEGLVRVSFGYFNSASELDELCQALLEISRQNARLR
jgi:cysteine desulfurase family protein